jgi:hypothetical protein
LPVRPKTNSKQRRRLAVFSLANFFYLLPWYFSNREVFQLVSLKALFHDNNAGSFIFAVDKVKQFTAKQLTFGAFLFASNFSNFLNPFRQCNIFFRLI